MVGRTPPAHTIKAPPDTFINQVSNNIRTHIYYIQTHYNYPRIKMPRYILFPLVFLTMLLATACGGDDDSQPDPPVPTEPETVNRTVVVYMVADNTLGSSSLDREDLKEMIKASAGGFEDGRLLVYWSPWTEGPYEPVTRLVEVTPDGLLELLTYPSDTKGASVEPDRITKVMADVKELAPAESYGLVFWSHANGWLGALNKATSDRYKAFGDDNGYHINITSLARALEGQKFDFIYFDCCLMGNIETIYELRNLTDRIVASPTDLGVEGMPYDLNAPGFFSPVPDLAAAAANTFDWYSSAGRECQMAVYDLTRLPEFTRATAEIFASLTDYPEGINSIQRYVKPGETCHSYDMEAYMELIASPEALAAWRAALDELVVYKATTQWGIGSLRISRYCGLGSFAIRRSSDIGWRGYSDLAWWTDVVSKAPAYAQNTSER